jgi:hypothetical protein
VCPSSGRLHQRPATNEAIYLKRIGVDLGILDEDYAVTLHEDSQACIKTAENPCLAERAKHFDIKYHWLREQISLAERTNLQGECKTELY